jgi:hypothetical protein
VHPGSELVSGRHASGSSVFGRVEFSRASELVFSNPQLYGLNKSSIGEICVAKCEAENGQIIIIVSNVFVEGIFGYLLMAPLKIDNRPKPKTFFFFMFQDYPKFCTLFVCDVVAYHMLPSVVTAACYHAKHKNCLLPSVARRSTASGKVSNIIPDFSNFWFEFESD